MTAPVSFSSKIFHEHLPSINIGTHSPSSLCRTPFSAMYSILISLSNPGLRLQLGLKCCIKLLLGYCDLSTLYSPVLLRDCKKAGIFDVSSSFFYQPSQLGLICKKPLCRQKIILYLSWFLFSFHE